MEPVDNEDDDDDGDDEDRLDERFFDLLSRAEEAVPMARVPVVGTETLSWPLVPCVIETRS